MSTRAVIAEPYGDEWRGRYHHSDGYPSGLGQELWNKIKEYGPDKVRQFLIHEHTGWSFILDADWNLEPGFVNKRYDEHMNRLDFRAQCYCHGDRNEKGWWIKRRGDTGGAEYAYVIGDHAMTIETRVCLNPKQEDFRKLRYKWAVTAHLNYAGGDVDFEAIEKEIQA